MTDYTKLIEEACSTAAKYELENYYGTSKDYTAMCKVEAEEAQRALQSAIEALQAENERLKPVVEKWKDECHRVQALFEKETLRASELHEKVEQINAHRNHILTSNDKLRAERDALAAKLDDLQRQEPVIDFTVLHQFASDQAINYNKLCTAVRMCLAAPKALEKQQPVAYRAWFDADNGARWLFTLWPEEEKLDVEWEPLFAAPKALEPLTDEQSATLFQALKDDPRSAKFSVQNWFTCGLVTAEAAHGIGGTP